MSVCETRSQQSAWDTGRQRETEGDRGRHGERADISSPRRPKGATWAGRSSNEGANRARQLRTHRLAKKANVQRRLVECHEYHAEEEGDKEVKARGPT